MHGSSLFWILVWGFWIEVGAKARSEPPRRQDAKEQDISAEITEWQREQRMD
jgi:hypothetical protein